MIFLLVVYHRENTVELTLVYMFSNCIIEPSKTCPSTQDVYTHSIGKVKKEKHASRFEHGPSEEELIFVIPLSWWCEHRLLRADQDGPWQRSMPSWGRDGASRFPVCAPSLGLLGRGAMAWNGWGGSSSWERCGVVRASPAHSSSCKAVTAVCSEGDPMREEWRRYTSETLLGWKTLSPSVQVTRCQPSLQSHLPRLVVHVLIGRKSLIGQLEFSSA